MKTKTKFLTVGNKLKRVDCLPISRCGEVLVLVPILPEEKKTPKTYFSITHIHTGAAINIVRGQRNSERFARAFYAQLSPVEKEALESEKNYLTLKSAFAVARETVKFVMEWKPCKW